ncbi:CHAD domain-containing protein [Kribbella sp. VKM Ac-2527]|uniref:CHAD domain-containing protein n=1 Tax=Kribbella caucasensis TaxID=2512215 RepID=A0A4R6IU15_9ACTN|nr:CHAD domain-containing protein [Kribbella sp. VKM Ac-2527]TDO26069.1 CHAD domain-containing protein [Kribbella sp. VKM Ac-2527]
MVTWVGEPLTGETPVGTLVAVALVKGTGRLQGAIEMLEKGEDDAIHQVRVSCRRLRSDLRLFRKLLAGDWAGELRADLAALAAACGEARDLEVIAALVQETATSEDDPEHVATILSTLTVGLERAAARSAEVVASERTVQLVKDLEAIAETPELKQKASRPCSEVLPQLLESARHTFSGAADQLKPWTEDDDWHEVRLLAKRVRYAADTSAAVLGEEAKEVATQAAKFQELLGQHQDHCAAADALKGLANAAAEQGDAELCFTLGRLTERHRAARKPLREEFLSLYHRP